MMNNTDSSSEQQMNILRKTRFKKILDNEMDSELKKKRNKRIRADGFADGRWTEKEHIIFVNLFKVFGNDWKSVKFFKI